MHAYVNENDVEDQSQFLQLGQSQIYNFFSFELGEPAVTSWVNFPTEDEPGSLFKYASIDIQVGLD